MPRMPSNIDVYVRSKCEVKDRMVYIPGPKDIMKKCISDADSLINATDYKFDFYAI